MSCKLLVCDVCAFDWTSCDRPCSRSFEIPSGTRLHDVDPSGRYALVSQRFLRRDTDDLRSIDMHDGRVLAPDVEVPHVFMAGLPPRLSSTGEMFLFEPPGLLRRTSRSIAKRTLDLEMPTPAHDPRFSDEGDRFSYITARHEVAVLHASKPTTHRPLGTKRITRACIDGRHDLLASAARGAIAVHRMVGGVIEERCVIATTGEIDSLALRFPWLAAIVRGGAEDGLLLWNIGSAPSLRMHFAQNVHEVALSRDGRYLAASLHKSVLVRDLEAGSMRTLDGHDGNVSFLRFVGGKDELVSADTKGRIVIWARAEDGYVRDVMDLPVR